MMPAAQPLLALAVLLGAWLVGRRTCAGGVSGPWASGPQLPVAAGVVTALLTAWMWGGLAAVPVWHDEVAYVLQAELLARFRLATAPAPVPEAFTQAAVLVTPVTAPKMLPGHALLLLPGVLVGLHGLMPVVLAGGAASLIVLLARRVAGPAVALLTVTMWTIQAGQQRWRASYMSESTTLVGWLLGWWCLLEWRRTRRTRWMLGLAACCGLMAVTRPLSALVFALPVGVVVLRDVVREQRWRSLGAGLAVGLGFLAIIPIQNHAVLGSWRASPLALYTRQYMPFDRLGFGLTTAAPALGLPPALDQAMASLRTRHAEHLPAALPRILAERAAALGQSQFRGWRVWLLPFFLVGFVALPATGVFAVATAALLLLAHLAYAHEPHWTAYYVEATPALAFVVAGGLVLVLRRASSVRGEPIAAGASLTVACLLCFAPDAWNARRFRLAAQAPYREFAAAIERLPGSRNLVLVRLGDGVDGHTSFVRNVVDRESASVLVALDPGQGGRAKLLSAFPDRVPYAITVPGGVATRVEAAP